MANHDAKYAIYCPKLNLWVSSWHIVHEHNSSITFTHGEGGATYFTGCLAYQDCEKTKITLRYLFPQFEFVRKSFKDGWSWL